MATLLLLPTRNEYIDVPRKNNIALEKVLVNVSSLINLVDRVATVDPVLRERVMIWKSSGHLAAAHQQ